MRRTLKAFHAWCRKHCHLRIADQHTTLSRKLRGHYAYFGITGNVRSLKRLRFHVERLWVKWLGRRSQRGRIAWEKAELLLERFPLPQPRIAVR